MTETLLWWVIALLCIALALYSGEQKAHEETLITWKASIDELRRMVKR